MGRFPGNEKFAFTVFDDTDLSTVENVGPVYRFLSDIGVRTTKSVWPLPGVPGAPIGGATLADKPYLEWVRELQKDGFELALHNAQNDDARREVTKRGLERFRELLGHYPRTHCNHHNNRENIYWGAARLSSLIPKLGYKLANRLRRNASFQGHVEDSPYFWGDLCKEHVCYVRNLIFDEINLDRINPTMPYHDPQRPYVNHWFSSSDGANVDLFCGTIREENQDRLEAEGGICIMYTHFANGFCTDGELHPEFERLMRRLVSLNGWFVPVATLLDDLKSRQASANIGKTELARMERRWFVSKLRKGTT